MVDLEIPSSYTFSPSEGTPHLTINHDVAADLDSTNAFEGPEKLLEVWFAPNSKSLPPGSKENGLKAVSEETWVGMLDMVNCKILSVLRSDHVDAYLLSESSMFVFPHKLILKTCGTTTLLLGLHRMLRIAAAEAGFAFHNAKSLDDIHAAATPYRVFYSRKNFLFPDKQRGPHRSWRQEVKYLDDMFEGGKAYMVGQMNGDHWYLYITSPQSALGTPPRTPEEGKSSSRSGGKFKIPTGMPSAFTGACDPSDETLEILMTDLDPENAKKFYLDHASAVAESLPSSQSQKPAASSAAPVDTDMAGSTATLDTTMTVDVEDEVDVFSNGSDSDLHDSHTPLSEPVDPELLMTEGHALGSVVSEDCGLSGVYPKDKYPEARIDSYLFSPCGFSANGIVPAPETTETITEATEAAEKATHYFTVHVTPEPVCSYASFETNVPSGQNGRPTPEIVANVVDIFKPGRFSVTLFEAKTADAVLPSKNLEIAGYGCTDFTVQDHGDYWLVFKFFQRDGWVGGNVAVGEEDF